MSMEGATGGFGLPEDGSSGAPRNPQHASAQKRLQQTQAQVNEVVGIMRVNVEKVLERDQKLSELDDRAVDIMRTNVKKVLDRDEKLTELDGRADALQSGASQFVQQAKKLKTKYWWKNLKMMIIMGVIGVVILIIIIVMAWPSGSGDSSSTAVTTTPHPQ